jgi:lipoyl(octanoyl) transferase
MPGGKVISTRARLPVCRLIVDPEPGAGDWNMAVDEALLESAVHTGQGVVRWYSWAEPTVSLGYFQDVATVAADPVLSGLPWVRRLTGGGAIVHHHEWTYSCVLPPQQSLVRHPYDLYDLVHDTVVAWFGERCGIALAQRGVTRRATAEPALCFLREDSHDVCYESVKVLGSAQRRRRGALLQHGSLLMRRSPFATPAAGLCDLRPDWRPGLLAGGELSHRLAAAVGQVVEAGTLTAAERSRAESLQSTTVVRLDRA